MPQSAITSPQAVSLAPDGTLEWSKSPDLLDLTIMSVTKAFTAYYALQNGMITDLDAARTFVGSTPSPTVLGDDDVCTVRDIYHAAMLPSQNGAADNIAYAALDIPGHASFLGPFMNDLEAWYASEFGWGGFQLNTPSGLDTNIVSAKMIGELFRAIHLNQPDLQDIMLIYPTSVTSVTGPNARTVTFTNNTNMFDVPEWRGSKGGSGSGTYAMGTFWEDPDNGIHTIGIIGAPSAETRRADIITIIADLVSEEPPPPPPPPPPTEENRFIVYGGVPVPVITSIIKDGVPRLVN